MLFDQASRRSLAVRCAYGNESDDWRGAVSAYVADVERCIDDNPPTVNGALHQADGELRRPATSRDGRYYVLEVN
ncbi:hypothetical protein ACQP2P_11780 [Dactylosporangium sp. CA-139114]|uniref:hypothetical protein n=1 Tax=Dactylosporangium sp. CA-139114 TaxID=3239931 RepID=UPI003D982ECB